MLGLVETLYNRLGRNSRTNHCVEVVELETDTPEGVTHTNITMRWLQGLKTRKAVDSRCMNSRYLVVHSWILLHRVCVVCDVAASTCLWLSAGNLIDSAQHWEWHIPNAPPGTEYPSQQTHSQPASGHLMSGGGKRLAPAKPPNFHSANVCRLLQVLEHAPFRYPCHSSFQSLRVYPPLSLNSHDIVASILVCLLSCSTVLMQPMITPTATPMVVSRKQGSSLV